MSRPIKLTEELLTGLAEDFINAARDIKMFDGKIDFSKTYTWKDDEKATVIFEPVAYTKMLRLIEMFSDEVAWHGLVTRDGEKVFKITDILVYPQVVTGSTVNTDQAAYTEWLYALSDEQFNAVRMQGHSHVNMGVTPSATDISHQERILEQLGDEDYYIFMIWNKKHDHTIKIFDLANNTLYESSDIILQIGDFRQFEKFEAEAKELVVKKTYSYGSYSGGGYQAPASTTPKSSGKITPVNGKNTDKKDKKNNVKSRPENTDGIGNGWSGRGLSQLPDYDRFGGGVYDYNDYDGYDDYGSLK